MSLVILTAPRLQSLGSLYLHCALSVSGKGQRWKELGVEPDSELPLDPASKVTRACLEMFLLSLLDHSQSCRSSPGPILSYYGCSSDCWGVFLISCQNLPPHVFSPLFFMVSLEQHGLTQLPLPLNSPLDSWSQLS